MESKVKFPWAKPDFWGNEKDYLIQALESTWISGGTFVDRLESEFALFCGSKYAVSASNGTTSLHLAFVALGIGRDDEVIVPGFCFMAAPNVLLHLGAIPVYADVDPETFCVTAEMIEPLITRKTRAIVPIHPYGNVCEMDEILSLGNRYNIPVIEDAAESFASKYKGKYTGTMGLMGSFSFQAAKTITTGEGGMILTDDESLVKKIALYRSHGLLRKKHYWHDVVGFNFRLTNLQAALGVAQLECTGEIIPQRKRVHEDYKKFLGSEVGISLQRYTNNIDPVLWAIALKLDPKAFPQGRDVVMSQMTEEGIETRPGFYTPSQMPHLYTCPALPNAERIASQIISLPTYASLTSDQIEFISTKLLKLRA